MSFFKVPLKSQQPRCFNGKQIQKTILPSGKYGRSIVHTKQKHKHYTQQVTLPLTLSVTTNKLQKLRVLGKTRAMQSPWLYYKSWVTALRLSFLWRETRAPKVSQNRPIYKSTSTKTIAETIKFSHLSPYKPGSPLKPQRRKRQPLMWLGVTLVVGLKLCT